MTNKDLKKELVSYIGNTDDEAFLSLLKELKQLAEEDDTKDTDTLDEFKKATHNSNVILTWD